VLRQQQLAGEREYDLRSRTYTVLTVLTCVAETKSGNLYAGPTKGSEFAVVSTCLFYQDVVRATYLNSSSKLLVEADISATVWRQIDGPINLARTVCAVRHGIA
jgi:hypothetical protein